MLLDFWRKSPSRTQRIITIAMFFMASLIVTIIGALTPLTYQEAQSINNELEQLRQSITVQQIFGNNFMLCLLMFIPVVGPFFGMWVLYNTGVVISAQTIASSVNISPVLLFLALFLFPFTWMEFISYSTAFAETVWIVQRIRQGLGKKEIKNAALLIAMTAVILLVAAVIEMGFLALL